MGANGSIERSDGVRVAFEVDGDEPDREHSIVLVHGITESRVTWDPVVPGLASEHRVVRVDLRGHGESSDAADYGIEALAGDVAAVVEPLGLDRPHLVGHSLGGAVVTFAAAAIPVSSVVNVDQPLQLWEMAALLQSIEAELRGAGFHTLLASVFDGLGIETVPEPERAALRALHASARPEVVLGIWGTLLTSTADELAAVVEAALRSVDAPYLSLHGSDPGDDYEEWLQRLVPSATVEVWPGLGHWLHLAAPDRFVERVNTFTVA